MSRTISVCFALALLFVAQTANASVIRITEAEFIAGSGLLTFSELAVGTVNPVYTPALYGGAAGSPTVSFGGFLVGQALGTAATCPPGAALSGCVVGSPTGPVALDPASPNSFITTDGAFPTSPTLSGSPRFNGPITLLFDIDLAGVGLDGGYFDAPNSTAITAYDRAGNILGQVTNIGTGIEFLGLVTDTGTGQIAALQFSLVGPEPAGFNIDNVRFGRQGEVVVPGGVPEPGTIALLASGLLGLFLVRRKVSA